MLFNSKKECQHLKVSPDKDASYCPDCGKYVENKWYLTRCSCCNVKLKTTMKFGEIVPEQKYCPNCGCNHFYIQEINSINFIKSLVPPYSAITLFICSSVNDSQLTIFSNSVIVYFEA